MEPAVLDIARRAAAAGGEVVARYFREGVTMRSKESYNLVSDADVEAEQAVAAVIRQAFPQHAIMGEETHTADAGAEHLWIVDPLDGTNNFAHGLDHFAVSVAYYYQGVAQCGVVLNPVRDEWYWAERGKGAWHNNRPLAVATHERLDQSFIGVGFFYDRGAMMEATLAAIGDLFRQNIHGIRRFGTASLDLVSVAAGHYGAFFEYELAPWDYAAGRLIVEEAGGRCTTCKGEELPIGKTSMLASNVKLHQAVLDIVQPRFV